MTLPAPVGWPLPVAAASNVTPQMRRIELSNPALAAFDYLPGQDMALAFSKDDGTTVRRRYTIRRFDRNRASLMIDVVLHGDGPGMRWARAARPGISIDAIGPRGKITLVDDAEWHLFAGDATAGPRALLLMGTLASAASPPSLPLVRRHQHAPPNTPPHAPPPHSL